MWESLGIHYAQSGIFTPSDIPFKRDAIAAESTPNIETVIFEDLDLDLLKKHRKTGSVLNWKDRRSGFSMRCGILRNRSCIETRRNAFGRIADELYRFSFDHK